eukprot:TRINITY_DN4585_c4_g1_i3.p1 TRINITY_DN4585_c4_g1~~TRINITY_DN4585_c4_g1_i3.p1  ORF type:complete len:945 (+),score=160.50 TRINITY_DN4585_c4_g1_i3:1937-4771(+)
MGLYLMLVVVLQVVTLCLAHTLSFGEYSYKVHSDAEMTVWTTATSHKITEDHELPTLTKGKLFLSAARNEFEPVQVIVQNTFPGTCTLELDLPHATKITFHEGGYVDGLLDTLTPITTTETNGKISGTISLTGSNKHTVLWITIFVSHEVQATGTQTGSLKITPPSGTATTVPVELYIYNFQISADINFVNHMTIGFGSILTNGASRPDDVKDFMYQHRMTPKGGATWPSGFNYQVSWESNNNPNKCSKFDDEPNESPPYSLFHLAPKYIKGEGWNCAGFPVHQAVQFVNNNTPRPTSFCGQSVGSDPKGTPAYNTEWENYIRELGKYVVDNGYQSKVFYYTMNEPQDAADDETAVFLCNLARKVAPELRICVSEEPKPEIAEQCAYDIWAASLRGYNQTYAWKRLEQGLPDEQVWLYSLPQDTDPYPNPTKTTNQGMHTRIWGFLSWSIRSRGYWYYQASTWFHNQNPTVRLELFREAWEDYEYLWLANGKKHPKPCTLTAADVPSYSVAKSLTTWTTSDDALMELRHQLGLYLEGTIQTAPEMTVPPSPPPAPVYINFQGDGSEPSADPLIVNGTTWVKMAWQPFNPNTGIGWEGQFIDKPSITTSGYRDGGFDTLWNSYLYDDYGRDNVFKYPLNPGTYDITVAVGRPNKLYSDKYNVAVNGVKAIDNFSSKNTGIAQIQATVTIEITDGLSVVWGGKDDNGVYAYTFINWLSAVPSQNAGPIEHPAKSICDNLNIPFVDSRDAEPSCRPCTVSSPVCYPSTPSPPSTLSPDVTDSPVKITSSPSVDQSTQVPVSTPLPVSSTYPPTEIPTTSIPQTPLPAGNTYAPTSVPETVSPATPLPDGATYAPTAVPTPLPEGSTYSPSAKAPPQNEGDDSSIEWWLILIIAVAAVCFCATVALVFLKTRKKENLVNISQLMEPIPKDEVPTYTSDRPNFSGRIDL